MPAWARWSPGTSPYAKTFGNPAEVPGVGSVGMSRQGLVQTEIGQLAELYTSGRDLVASWLASASLEPAFQWWRIHANAGGSPASRIPTNGFTAISAVNLGNSAALLLRRRSCPEERSRGH